MPQPERKNAGFAAVDEALAGVEPAKRKAVSAALADVADTVRAAHPYQQKSADAFAGWTEDHWGLLLAAVTSDDPTTRQMIESMASLEPAKVLALANVLVRFGWATANAERDRPRLLLAT